MSNAQSFLRQRNVTSFASESGEKPDNVANKADTRPKHEVVWGKTPAGEVFRVPTTHDVLTLFNPKYPKSHLDMLNLALLGSQIVLFCFLPRRVSQVFFLFYFAFWRAAYDAGLGWVLTKQSKKKWIEREVKKRGWLDEKRRPAVRNWIRAQLAGKMGSDYSFDDLPLEYNTWLLFRQAVDIILLNDFVAYCMFAFACFRIPDGLSSFVHVMRWIGGLALIAFNLWVKTEAHNVVKDYGWYWGDCFFQRGALVFDGVFELAPHPMYSVGYAGYYGLSLIAGSYPVLFVSLAAHAAQFAFLVCFENPHIERMYGKRKAIAKRTPLSMATNPPTRLGLVTPPSATTSTSATTFEKNEDGEDVGDLPTPSATEGETATETDLETETETENETEVDENVGMTDDPRPMFRAATKSTSKSSSSPLSSASAVAVFGSRSQTATRKVTKHTHTHIHRQGMSDDLAGVKTQTQRKKAVSQHDLLNKYFRRDAVVFRNLDVFRAPDTLLLILLLYTTIFSILPASIYTSPTSLLVIHFTHSLAWCLFHCFGLGLVLRAQSRDKFLVRHYLKNYQYVFGGGCGGEGEEGYKAAIGEAFSNFKGVYNVSLCMSYASFIGVVWRTYSIPNDWTVGHELLRHTLGVALIGLHVWATLESYEALGVFGWFFGDFFMEEFPPHLEYSGIYRYLNNPEVMGGAAWFGFGFISGSKLVFSLAVIRHLGHWWFLSSVENPHMKKLYGDSLRKDAGFVKVIKNVASKNARLLESRLGAGKHAPEIRRVVKEVKGTVEKVFEETADVVEEFLTKSRPKISGVVQDTKILLQQSREKLVITRVANDLSGYDTSKYTIEILPSSSGTLNFHLGEPIRIKWQAPRMHSRKDWIGIYRVGANKSNLVTKTSSMGMWAPVYDEEWDGDFPLGLERSLPDGNDNGNGNAPLKDSESGVVTFRGNNLPWISGRYEIRYHHDGKYNVMSMDGPIEIYVDKPTELTFPSVRESLMRIVPLCLDSDPSLIPLSCKMQLTPKVEGQDQLQDDPPDDLSTLSSSMEGQYQGSTHGHAHGHEHEHEHEHDYDHETPKQEGDGDGKGDIESPDDPHRDPDDFSFWSERQAKRISSAIKQAFDVDCATEIVVADANLTMLANRILLAKQM